jgi:chemotaxis protein methyltransferase CheR
VARRWKFAGFEDLARAIRQRPEEALLRDVTEAMTTNESFFFRDTKPFEQFRTLVLPSLMANRGAGRSIRIWSAACSSGQEPYSLAMILSEEGAKLNGWRIEIVATDLSSEILTRAQEGLYTQFEVQRGLPIALLVKYFTQEGDKWRISEKLRRMVTYRPFNLLADPAVLGRFDVVFCRNVLIYFDAATKSRVLDRLAAQLAADGYLFLGGAETVLGVSERFQLLPGQRGVYGLAKQATPTVKAAS